jgi:hypothetical protein
MEQKWFDVEIIGKTTEQKGIFFKSTAYIVAFKFADGETIDRELPFAQYSDLHIGKKISIAMYSLNGKRWYFSAEDARFATMSMPY